MGIDRCNANEKAQIASTTFPELQFGMSVCSATGACLRHHLPDAALSKDTESARFVKHVVDLAAVLSTLSGFMSVLRESEV